MNRIQHLPLGLTPEGRDKQILRSVAGQTVNHQIRAGDLQAADDQIHIFIQGQYVKAGILIISGQIRVL